VFGVIMLVLGFRAMMEHTAEKETSPTLWIVIPIVTVVGIAIYRLNMALAHNFGVEWAPGSVFAFLVWLFAVQIVFGLVGYAVMRRFGYFGHFVSGDGRSPGSFALICPGVALFVFGNFVISQGVVGVGLVEKFSVAYFLLPCHHLSAICSRSIPTPPNLPDNPLARKRRRRRWTEVGQSRGTGGAGAHRRLARRHGRAGRRSRGEPKPKVLMLRREPSREARCPAISGSPSSPCCARPRPLPGG
jgi:hypothetical protein